jgi:hypothetical protein
MAGGLADTIRELLKSASKQGLHDISTAQLRQVLADSEGTEVGPSDPSRPQTLDYARGARDAFEAAVQAVEQQRNRFGIAP